MTQKDERRPTRRRAALFVLAALVGAVCALVFHPLSPLPRHWNPAAPLVVSDPVSPLTRWKLRRTVSNPVACLMALEGEVEGNMLEPLVHSDQCHIQNRVRISEVGEARIAALETSCATALKLAMWEHHGLQPAAVNILGQPIDAIGQIGSYNCRAIRTPRGQGNRMSTHATADAVDITGFRFMDGTTVNLVNDWDRPDDVGRFLRVARDTACDWFGTTLGPDFNSLHADHFHLQVYGWGTCR